MSVTQAISRDALLAQQRAVERRRQHREAALSVGTDWRPFHVTPATVRVAGDPVGMERPTSQCVRLEDGSWKYIGADAEASTA